jgi:hypothetical protein
MDAHSPTRMAFRCPPRVFLLVVPGLHPLAEPTGLGKRLQRWSKRNSHPALAMRFAPLALNLHDGFANRKPVKRSLGQGGFTGSVSR